MKKILLTISLITLMLFLVACGQATGGVQSSLFGDGDIKNVKVIADQLDVKSGCSSTSPTITTSPKNTALNVLGKVEDWYAVKLPNNAIGFVPQNQCKPIASDESTTPTPQTIQTPGTSTPVPTPAAPNKTPAGSQTDANANALTAAEQQMLTLVNQARSQNNAGPLTVDPQLTNMARLKSQDMINNNYFSHNSPTYGSPFDMMKSFGISYVKAGENLAGNRDVQAAHNALMNSPGHRKNILDPDFTHIGIGIKKGGTYGNMFTQEFVSRPK